MANFAWFRTRYARVILVLSGVVALMATGCATSSTNSVTAFALWYGTDDGQMVSGVTPVEIKGQTQREPQAFAVDLEQLTASGAGAAWTATTATAAVIGTLAYAADPQTVRLGFKVNEAIDGPSAGALLALGSYTVLANGNFNSKATMTGTILPDGRVGAVGGIPEKIRAAAQAGMAQVLIPQGQRFASDQATEAMVDVIELGRALGVEVIEIETFWDAPGVVASIPQPGEVVPAPEMDTALTEMLITRSRELLANAEQISRALTGTSPEVAEARAKAVQALDVKDASGAYAWSSEVLTEVAVLASDQDTSRALATTNAAQVAKMLLDRVQQLQTQITMTVHAIDMNDVTTLEQAVALSDALRWAADAYADLLDAEQALITAPVRSELLEWADTVARIDVVVQQYLPTSLAALAVIGNRPILDRTVLVEDFQHYAQFFATAAAANTTYAQDVTGVDASDTAFASPVEVARQVWQGSEAFAADIDDPLLRAAITMSAANSYFITSASLSAELAQRASGIVSDPARTLDRISQTDVSSVNIQRGRLAAVGLDSSYLLWNDQWGSNLVQSETSGNQLEGVFLQWTALTSGQVLLALGKSQPTPQ